MGRDAFAGEYCGTIDEVLYFLEITVMADGAIFIALFNDSSTPFSTAEPSVPCTGGSFDVKTENGTGDPISGTVGCGGVSITGKYDNIYEYTATIEGCFASDIRLKTNIEALPISREGYNLYKFQYIDDQNENTYVGVMAQDILSRNPEAVVENEAGFYMVRYARLGLKMVTLEE